jgi:hypothetical protein
MTIEDLRANAALHLDVEREVASLDVAPVVARRAGADRFSTGVRLGGILADYDCALFFFQASVRAFSAASSTVHTNMQSETALYEQWEQSFAFAVAEAAIRDEHRTVDTEMMQAAAAAISMLVMGELPSGHDEADAEVSIGVLDLLCIGYLSESWGNKIVSDEIVERCQSVRVHWKFAPLHAGLSALVDGKASMDVVDQEYRKIATAANFADGLVDGMRFIHLFHLSLVRNEGDIPASVVRLFPENEAGKLVGRVK